MRRVIDVFKINPAYFTKGEVGIEIEVEGVNLPPGNMFWRTERDGSLDDGGIEYILREPMKREAAFNALDDLGKMYKEYGTKVKDTIRAGIHIHVNVQEFTLLELYNFITLYLVLEEVLVHYCGPSREGNLFCLRASDAPYLLEAIRQSLIHREFDLYGNDELRYASMNLVAIPKYGSLEFRSMRSTPDMEAIKTWIDMLLLVRDKSKQYRDPTHIIRSFSEAEYEFFVRDLFGDLYKHFEDAPIADMAKRGMRNAQDIAYCVDWDKLEELQQHNIFLKVQQRGMPIHRPAHDRLREPRVGLFGYKDEAIKLAKRQEDKYGRPPARRGRGIQMNIPGFQMPPAVPRVNDELEDFVRDEAANPQPNVGDLIAAHRRMIEQAQQAEVAPRPGFPRGGRVR